MSVIMQETTTKLRSNKTLSTTKSILTFFTRINSILINIKNLFLWIIEKLSYLLSKWSMINHFILILVPLSICIIILIFFIHLNFFDNLFRFNYYKGVKEEFLDLYVTEIDDLHSELEAFIIKESYLDTENIIFFDIYFRELSSLGLIDNSSENFFPDLHYESNKIYQEIDAFYKLMGNSSEYSIKENEAEVNIDNRNDSLKEFAKIYFYMLPIINYGVYFSGILIDQTFLIAYEFDDERNVIGDELYFCFPKANIFSVEGENFLVSHGYLSPLINKGHHENSQLINDNYYKENFFKKKDWDFRRSVDFNKESWFDISLGHLNNELNGNVTKKLILISQLNINRDKRHFMVNLVEIIDQLDLSDIAIELTSFISKNNSDIYEWLTTKYSDNETFVVTLQEFTEYSLTMTDNKFFHYGLYDNNYNFMKNGVNFDSFNLNLLSEPFKYYSTVDGYNYDLKYLTTLFLYSQLFRNIHNSEYKKDGEEISLYKFSDEIKVKNLCKKINLTKHIEYIKSEKDIDCWDSLNLLYYSEEDYKNATLFDSYKSIPNCACLPLYCLNNFKNLKNNNYKFSDDNIVSTINLPNKCQNKFDYYLNKENELHIDNYAKSISYPIFYLFNSDAKTPEKEYIKIQKENITQLPGYYLIVFSEIKSNSVSLFFLFYNSLAKIEVISIVIFLLSFIFIITIFIIYRNLKKFSLIIEEFTQKYEKFVFHSRCSDIDALNQEKVANTNNILNNNVDKTMNNRGNINEEFSPFLQNGMSLNTELYNNDNTLIEDLFSLYCKNYKISRKELEKYYQQKTHETKYQMKLKMMTEKNELFKLLCMFSLYAPYFRLNLSLEYNMYKYSKIIKKYDQYLEQVGNFDKEKAKLTKNILYELLSTENLSDYGLVMNLNFKYISNINAENKENSIKNALFKNVINKIKVKNEEYEDDDDFNINDIFFILKDGDENNNIKLVLKKKNELMEIFKNKFESDDFLNFHKIESAFNFFLINSYYKYLRQISLEDNNK